MPEDPPTERCIEEQIHKERCGAIELLEMINKEGRYWFNTDYEEYVNIFTDRPYYNKET